MTGSKCLLDTSVIIDAFKKNNTVAETLDSINNVYVPIFAEGELFYGAYKSGMAAKHITQITLFLSNCEIMLPDRITAEVYGKSKSGIN